MFAMFETISVIEIIIENFKHQDWSNDLTVGERCHYHDLLSFLQTKNPKI